jgi:hypothetical protein
LRELCQKPLTLVLAVAALPAIYSQRKENLVHPNDSNITKYEIYKVFMECYYMNVLHRKGREILADTSQIKKSITLSATDKV